jgi:hypothetical protein
VNDFKRTQVKDLGVTVLQGLLAGGIRIRLKLKLLKNKESLQSTALDNQLLDLLKAMSGGAKGLKAAG